MKKDKDSKKLKVNFFTIKVSPATFFLLDFALTVAFLLLFDIIWSKITNEKFTFGILGNIGLPLVLSVVGTIAMVSNANSKEK